MSLVLGPAYNIQHVTSESINILKMLGSGEMKMGAPKLGAGIVDVRDVAVRITMRGTILKLKAGISHLLTIPIFLKWVRCYYLNMATNIHYPRKPSQNGF